MDKKYAFLFALILAGLIISDLFIFTSFSVKENNRENVMIERVIDGDTLKLSDGRTIRLININSPEKGTPNANLSAIFLKSFENKSIDLEVTGTDRYNRVLARIYAPEYLNLELVRQGLASKFLVQESELKIFSGAEESAIKNSLGIWRKSSFFGCFDSSIDQFKEEVVIKNRCPEISLQGWMLKDESRKIYSFENLSFEKITIHSGYGTDNVTDLFWGNKDNIWNDDRDSLYLFEPDGRIAHYETYGY